jgi:hypothetical protein
MDRQKIFPKYSDQNLQGVTERIVKEIIDFLRKYQKT